MLYLEKELLWISTIYFEIKNTSVYYDESDVNLLCSSSSFLTGYKITVLESEARSLMTEQM